MLLTVAEFCQRVENDFYRFADELARETGRSGELERSAWSSSFKRLSTLLQKAGKGPAHLYFAGAGHAGIEYTLPPHPAYMDAVLLGETDGRNAAVVLELKHWDSAGDKPGIGEGVILRDGKPELHPSEQVCKYTELIKNFHSEVDDRTDVSGVVLFTHPTDLSVYGRPPNATLTAAYPYFDISRSGVDFERAVAHLTRQVRGSNQSFAKRFYQGHYRQDRRKITEVAARVLNDDHGVLALVDNQHLALRYCTERIREHIRSTRDTGRKLVIVVKGPPGSGKSVVALKLWAELEAELIDEPGNLYFCTTSGAQTGSWEHVVQRIAGRQSGVVQTVSRLHPMGQREFNALRDEGRVPIRGRGEWREALQDLADAGIEIPPSRQDDANCLVIVDEAHSLMNPESPVVSGPVGFNVYLGPLGYHVMRTSRVSVFFLDPEQGYRDKENTTVAELRQWATELGAEYSEELDLSGAQFRCGGSVEYVNWLEGLLANRPVSELVPLAGAWMPQARAVSDARAIGDAGLLRGLDFRIFDTPSEMESALRERARDGADVRLLASYAREWKSKDIDDPAHPRPGEFDFEIAVVTGPRPGLWRKVWNVIQRPWGYAAWVAAPAGSLMHQDPLSQVGCPYVVRGFDYDYVGVLWMKDLRTRDGQLVADKEHIWESGLEATMRSGDAEALRKSLAQAYRILLTRGIKGIYLWFEDEATRRHVESALGLG